ncbi:MAG: hypothetical protein MHPSP_000738, partial [Paramarteilia canceri]
VKNIGNDNSKATKPFYELVRDTQFLSMKPIVAGSSLNVDEKDERHDSIQQSHQHLSWKNDINGYDFEKKQENFLDTPEPMKSPSKDSYSNGVLSAIHTKNRNGLSLGSSNSFESKSLEYLINESPNNCLDLDESTQGSNESLSEKSSFNRSRDYSGRRDSNSFMEDKNLNKAAKKARSRVLLNYNQTLELEQAFSTCHYPDIELRKRLAEKLNLPAGKIQIWFSNRRAKQRREERESVNKEIRYKYPNTENCLGPGLLDQNDTYNIRSNQDSVTESNHFFNQMPEINRSMISCVNNGNIFINNLNDNFSLKKDDRLDGKFIPNFKINNFDKFDKQKLIQMRFSAYNNKSMNNGWLPQSMNISDFDDPDLGAALFTGNKKEQIIDSECQNIDEFLQGIDDKSSQPNNVNGSVSLESLFGASNDLFGFGPQDNNF